MQENTSNRRIGKSATESPKKKKNIRFPEPQSFFDHDEDDLKEMKSLWTKVRQIHLADLKNKVILEGSFEKKGKRTGIWKTRLYILTQNYLIYQENKKSGKYLKASQLDRVRIEYITLVEKNKPKKFGFRLLKNKDVSEIYTSDYELYEKFKTELEFRCIQLNFQDKYSVEKLIGKGSFGRVYLVKRNTDKRNFASKMFLKDAIYQQAKGKATLMNEINLLRSLDHPGIMRLYEVHESSIAVYMIVELLSGGELFERLKEKKTYTENDCAMMLKRIIEPLIYVQDRNIVHRDLKPENLILRSKASDYDIVVADFGLATELKPNKILHMRCGTPGYCAPEIINSKSKELNYDLKVDVFSLGCVFYHIMTGRSPFLVNKDHKNVFARNKKCEISFDDPKIHTFSTNAQDLLKKMLARSPDDRPSFREILLHEFFIETGKFINESSLNIVKQTFVAKSINDKRNSIDLHNSHTKETYGSLQSAEIGSFVMARSNFFRGNLDTVQEMSLNNITDPRNMNLLPVVGNNADGFNKNRRSSFSRYSQNQIPSLTPDKMKSEGFKESPSILINSIIPIGENNQELNISRSSKNSASGSSISNVRSRKDSENDVEAQQESIIFNDKEPKSVSKQVKFLKSRSFHNPFFEENTNAESLLELKMGFLRHSGMSIKSLTYSQSRTFEELRGSNSEGVLIYPSRLRHKTTITNKY